MQPGLSAPSAEECKAHPGASTPRGMHWFYRINRGDKHHCWYLGSVQTHAVVQAAAPQDAAEREAADADANANAQAAPAPASSPRTAPGAAALAPIALLDATLAAQKAQTDFTARWPNDLPSPQNLKTVEAETSSDSFAEQPARAEQSEAMPSWPALAAVGTDESFTGDALRYFLFPGGSALALLLLIGWAAKFMRPPDSSRVRDRWHAMRNRLYRNAHGAATAERRSVAPGRHDPLAWPPTPTDPAVDLRTSLSELIRDLRQTQAALDSGDVFGRPARRGEEILQAAE
jgi:hypothetical protein